MLLPLVLRRESPLMPGPLLLAGKLNSWGVIGTIHPGKLVHVVDSSNGASYLVDTGSSFSILHLRSSSSLTLQDVPIGSNTICCDFSSGGRWSQDHGRRKFLR